MTAESDSFWCAILMFVVSIIMGAIIYINFLDLMLSFISFGTTMIVLFFLVYLLLHLEEEE